MRYNPKRPARVFIVVPHDTDLWWSDDHQAWFVPDKERSWRAYSTYAVVVGRHRLMRMLGRLERAMPPHGRVEVSERFLVRGKLKERWWIYETTVGFLEGL